MSDEICPHGYGASGDTCVMVMDDKDCLCAVIEERDRLRSALEAAEKSLYVISDQACIRGNDLEHGEQIRGYARSRGDCVRRSRR